MKKADENLKKYVLKNRQLSKKLYASEKNCKQLMDNLDSELANKSTVARGNHVDQARIIITSDFQTF